MPQARFPQSAQAVRYSGLYRIIPRESYAEFGIESDDVPIGTFPALDHPPYLPNRFGGNAYGLGLFEQSMLPADESSFLDSIDLEKPELVAEHHLRINDLFKRLGLFIRYSKLGLPFYLIPRQLLTHYLVEVRAKVERIEAFLNGLLSRRLRESLSVGLISAESELLLPELQNRLPHLQFSLIANLDALTRESGPYDAMILVGDPKQFALAGRRIPTLEEGAERRIKEAFGHFVAGRIYDLLSSEGEVLGLCDRPLGTSREVLEVKFLTPIERKRFLLFCHIYRTRRRYSPGEGEVMKINRFDFHSFLSGIGVWHETTEGLIAGRSLEEMTPDGIDQLPYHDLPLPRGSAPQLITAWKRWLGPFFNIQSLGTELPDIQRQQWEQNYALDGEPPDTLVVLHGWRRPPALGLDGIISQRDRSYLAGCSLELLADYKDSFEYVGKVLAILGRIKQGVYHELPGLELSRLRKPFESAARTEQLSHVLELMANGARLKSLEDKLNPLNIMGTRTPVIANLEKLSLMSLSQGVLRQLYLIVVGHSTMSRVTFGKLPMTSLGRITDLRLYDSLDEAVRVLRIYRLLSVAETAAAGKRGLTGEQVQELFSLYDNAIRVVSDPSLDWEEILARRTMALGGVQATATRKMLKIFDLFEYLDSWRELELAGPRKKETLSGYDAKKLKNIEAVNDLTRQIHRFVGRFYARDSFARPFFFRALLNSEIHGSGRVLSELGTEAGFTLLWICVHVSHRRLLNFNPLIKYTFSVEQRDRLLNKLRRALSGLSHAKLSPGHLENFRQQIITNGEAYIYDSGLLLTENPKTLALEPLFIDVAEELELLGREIAEVGEAPIEEIPDKLQRAMDRRIEVAGSYLKAQEEPLERMNRTHRELVDTVLGRMAGQLMAPESFSERLELMVKNLPHLMNKLLPGDDDPRQRARRRAAAAKLSALHLRRMEGFQDMWLSHEAARAEFGPATAGVLGVTPLQFQILNASLAQLHKKHPRLVKLLMAAILLYRPRGAGRQPSDDATLIGCLELKQKDRQDLGFLVENHDIFWSILSGQAAPAHLGPVLGRQDPPLVEALFLLSVLTAAVLYEGLLSEDLLEGFFSLLGEVRHLGAKGSGAAAQDHEIESRALALMALERYQELKGGAGATVSLRHLMESSAIPDDQRDTWLERGRMEAGLARLIKLRGLYYVEPLDVRLLRQEVPLPYIYRHRGLRSIGETHFERDLYESLRLLRALERLDPRARGLLLGALSDPSRPLGVHGYSEAAGLLTYPNQVKLLLLGCRAALAKNAGQVSYAPLASVIRRKFEMVNQELSKLDPAGLVAQDSALESFASAREGLTLSYSGDGGTVSLGFGDPIRFDRKLMAVRKAKTPSKLKRVYHQQLKSLKFTAYHTMEYQTQLDRAFRQRLEYLAGEMVDEAREAMAATQNLDGLGECFAVYWDQGLELPLGPDRQQMLRDIFEMNLERLRGAFLGEVMGRLQKLRSVRELDKYWQEVKGRLISERRYLGQDFEIMLADSFDRRTAELNAYQGE